LITKLRKINFYLSILSFWKIPLLFYCRPRVIYLGNKTIKVKIKLRRKVKNHLGSMYLGALAIGADITSGYFAVHFSNKKHKKIALVFKDFHADFLKRPTGDVVFECSMGNEINDMIDRAIETKDRQNLPVHVHATVPSISDEIVASFTLTLSVKVKP
tara:strand:+ start:196 stop:669 length:474 start_codon:yes stop_codon:yes gene_type:complete